MMRRCPHVGPCLCRASARLKRRAKLATAPRPRRQRTVTPPTPAPAVPGHVSLVQAVTISANDYLDCRHPAWSRFEAAGQIRAVDGTVRLTAAVVAELIRLAGATP